MPLVGGEVPVQLADPARLQAHVHPGNLRSDRQLTHRDLARQAAREEAVALGGSTHSKNRATVNPAGASRVA